MDTIAVYRDENLLILWRYCDPADIDIQCTTEDVAEVFGTYNFKCPDCHGKGVGSDGSPCWCDDGLVLDQKAGYISRRDADWLESGEHFRALLLLRYGPDKPASIADWWTGQTKPIFKASY